ncbi:MAG: DUF3011 domain-containing protein [Rubrivivax sp.]|nr:DUF3011 domain-containing protein [Rubrivivax sp.]
MMRRAVTGLVCAALALPHAPAQAEETIRCDSQGLGYNYCRVDTDDHVELTRKHSLFSCHEGRSWGYDRRGVWVNHGCSADFKVGRRGHGGKAAAVAVAGIAALIALSASRHKAETQEVAAWAVGSFKGRDEKEGVPVELSILPGGRVQGKAGSHEFTGQLKGNRLEAGRHVFRIDQSGPGFIATDEQDPLHRVEFQHVGSGY